MQSNFIHFMHITFPFKIINVQVSKYLSLPILASGKHENKQNKQNKQPFFAFFMLTQISIKNIQDYLSY